MIATLALMMLIPSFAPAQGGATEGRQDQPPSITYPSTRKSEKWIDTGRVSVAVDKGVTWQGVTVYLSLTSELVAVDDKTGKTLWSADVGGYWRGITFEYRDVRCEPARWLVKLLPTPADPDGANRYQYHDLRTGTRDLEFDRPVGDPLVLPGQWSGSNSNLATPLMLLVENNETWTTKVLKPMFEGRNDAPAFGAIDFSKHRVLVISSGDTTNCLGIGGKGWASAGRILVRLEHATVQSGPDGIKARPFGIFVLPRKPDIVAVETNVQRYIGGPPIWKETLRFEPLLK